MSPGRGGNEYLVVCIQHDEVFPIENSGFRASAHRKIDDFVSPPDIVLRDCRIQGFGQGTAQYFRTNQHVSLDHLARLEPIAPGDHKISKPPRADNCCADSNRTASCQGCCMKRTTLPTSRYSLGSGSMNPSRFIFCSTSRPLASPDISNSAFLQAQNPVPV